MPPSATPAQSKFVSSLRDFWAGGSNPTDESVGYDQPSLRDSDRQPAASTPPVGEDGIVKSLVEPFAVMNSQKVKLCGFHFTKPNT